MSARSPPPPERSSGSDRVSNGRAPIDALFRRRVRIRRRGRARAARVRSIRGRAARRGGARRRRIISRRGGRSRCSRLIRRGRRRRRRVGRRRVRRAGGGRRLLFGAGRQQRERAHAQQQNTSIHKITSLLYRDCDGPSNVDPTPWVSRKSRSSVVALRRNPATVARPRPCPGRHCLAPWYPWHFLSD